jgi:hypothetical protein
VPRVRALLVEPTAVPLLLHTTLAAACDEIEMLETNMRAVERQLGALASEMADVTLLQTVPRRRGDHGHRARGARRPAGSGRHRPRTTIRNAHLFATGIACT